MEQQQSGKKNSDKQQSGKITTEVFNSNSSNKEETQTERRFNPEVFERAAQTSLIQRANGNHDLMDTQNTEEPCEPSQSESSKKEVVAHEFGKTRAMASESKDFIAPNSGFVVAGPNSQIISYEELMNSFNGFTNMYLAHEISLDETFQIKQYIPPPESIESRIQVQLKKAFWDLFNEDIHKDPPDYGRALSIFKEVKDNVFEVLLPHNNNTRKDINEVLDVEHISRLINNDAFTHEDFKKYSAYIIGTLAHICCPSRDADIEALKHLDEPSEIFEGILDVTGKMKLDMANFRIRQIRPSVIQYCGEYERSKFADFFQMEYRLKEDGLRATRNWLARHADNQRDVGTVLAKAFLELLEFNWNGEAPETLSLDMERYRVQSRKILRLTIIGTIAITVGAIAQTILMELPKEFRDLLKTQMEIIIADEDIIDTRKFNSCVESAAMQAISIVEGAVMHRFNRKLTPEESGNIRQCVRELQTPDNKVRGLIYRRILEYVEQVIMSRNQFQIQVPAGLYSVRSEVAILSRDYAQLVWHNRTVYGNLYTAIIENKLKHLTQFDDNDELEYKKTLEILQKEDIESPPSSPAPAPGTSSTSC